jgi:hypothetical protein
MRLTKTTLVAEVVGLVVVLVVITWLEATLTKTIGFWPILIYSAIYIGGRAVMLARRTRSR